MESFLLFWLLPSCVVFLVISLTSRLDNDLMCQWDGAEWARVLFASFVWPFGVVVILLYFLISGIAGMSCELTKERKLFGGCKDEQQ